jgi:hypothetical protein
VAFARKSLDRLFRPRDQFAPKANRIVSLPGQELLGLSISGSDGSSRPVILILAERLQVDQVSAWLKIF